MRFIDAKCYTGGRRPQCRRAGDVHLRSRTLLAGLVTLILCASRLSAASGALPLCESAPRTECRSPVRPTQAALLLRDATPETGNQVVWKWRKGAATAVAEFGDPQKSVDYAFCVFDATGARILRASVPAGGLCGQTPCWRPTGLKGFIYRNSTAQPDGITDVALRAGDTGMARITLKGKGSSLSMPALLSLVLPLRVQLQTPTDSACWEAAYTADGVLQHDSGKFRARGDAFPGAAEAGKVNFFRDADSEFDRYTSNPTPQQQEWMRTKFWRMLVYVPYFNARVGWFPNAWFYKDLYAIYVNSVVATEHPEWILRDAGGTRLYIPWGCANGTCPQYAADPGNQAFRDQWIAAARTTLAKGYRGLYVDDVNLELSRVSDGSGRAVVPIDPRSGGSMTVADWRRYMAEFTEAIRAAFPQAEIVHNVLWFLGTNDPSIQRELLSADFINIERGVNDAGIHGGGTYGFETFLAYVDWLHARARYVLLDASATTLAEREYGLAAYFLLRSGNDGTGNKQGATPDNWWPAYQLSLGDALGDRYAWQGVLRRDFQQGFVLVNEPDASTVTLDLGNTYLDLSGQPRTSVTLGPAAGAVLRTQ